MINRLLHIYAWGTILIATFLLLLIVIWELFPRKTIEFNNVPFSVVPKVVNAGDTLTYTVDYCKYTDTLPITNITFIDGIAFSTPSFVGGWEKGCTIKNVTIQIPSVLPGGNYYLRIVHRLRVNPLKQITIDVVSERFEVINNIEELE